MNLDVRCGRGQSRDTAKGRTRRRRAQREPAGRRRRGVRREAAEDCEAKLDAGDAEPDLTRSVAIETDEAVEPGASDAKHAHVDFVPALERHTITRLTECQRSAHMEEAADRNRDVAADLKQLSEIPVKRDRFRRRRTGDNRNRRCRVIDDLVVRHRFGRRARHTIELKLDRRGGKLEVRDADQRHVVRGGKE